MPLNPFVWSFGSARCALALRVRDPIFGCIRPFGLAASSVLGRLTILRFLAEIGSAFFPFGLVCPLRFDPRAWRASWINSHTPLRRRPPGPRACDRLRSALWSCSFLGPWSPDNPAIPRGLDQPFDLSVWFALCALIRVPDGHLGSIVTVATDGNGKPGDCNSSKRLAPDR